LARLRRAKRNLGFYWDFILWQTPYREWLWRSGLLAAEEVVPAWGLWSKFSFVLAHFPS
jgi:hypothetical protein